MDNSLTWQPAEQRESETLCNCVRSGQGTFSLGQVVIYILNVGNIYSFAARYVFGTA